MHAVVNSEILQWLGFFYSCFDSGEIGALIKNDQLNKAFYFPHELYKDTIDLFLIILKIIAETIFLMRVGDS